MNTGIYSQYGFNIESELPLTALPAEEASKKDVRIFYHPVNPKGISSPNHSTLCIQSNQDHYWLNVPSVARFLVSHGQSIHIDPVSGATDNDLRVFLHTLCMEALLKQRHVLLLPGFILFMEGKTAAVTGTTGFPFQQLALLFLNRGAFFINTSQAAINQDILGLPGVPQFEIWEETALKFKIPTGQLSRLRRGVDKYIMPLQSRYSGKARPLDCIFYLQSREQDEAECAIQNGNLPLIHLRFPRSGFSMLSLAAKIQQQLTQDTLSHVTA